MRRSPPYSSRVTNALVLLTKTEPGPSLLDHDTLPLRDLRLVEPSSTFRLRFLPDGSLTSCFTSLGKNCVVESSKLPSYEGCNETAAGEFVVVAESFRMESTGDVGKATRKGLLVVEAVTA